MPTCTPCPICRKEDKRVPAQSEIGLSLGRMGENERKELGMRQEQEEGIIQVGIPSWYLN